MPYPSKGKSAFTRDKTLDQKDYSMAAMAALKAAVETYGYEMELAKYTTTDGVTPEFDSPNERILELHEVYFQLLINKVPGDVPAAFPGSTVATEAQAGPTTPTPSSGSGGAGGHLITFGKHASKTIETIDNSDPGYVRWLADKAQDAEVQKAARSYLDAKYAKAEEEDPYAA